VGSLVLQEQLVDPCSEYPASVASGELRPEIDESETDFLHDRWADDGGNLWIGFSRGNESEGV